MKPRLLLIYSADGMANSLRADKLRQAFTQAGLRVELLDSRNFFKDFYQRRSQDTWWSWLKYKLRFLKPLFNIFPYYKLASKYPFMGKLKERAWAIRFTWSFITSRYILVQSPFEIFLVKKIYPWQTIIYDAHTCLADELRPGANSIPQKELDYLADQEARIIRGADILTFSWPAVRNYLVSKYELDQNKIVSAPWGTESREVRSKWKKLPKIVYLGNTDDYWVKPSNLVKWSNSELEIDIYGRTNNPQIKKLKNYCGYLPSQELNRLASYQFGLISLSQDSLRRQTFSAKHIFYYSFGLPVLCPSWRRDPLLAAGTIYYESDNLAQVVKEYSQPKLWLEKSQAALEIAQKYRWSEQLQPLVNKVSMNSCCCGS